MDNLLQKHHAMMSIRSLIWSFGSPSLVTATTDKRWQSDEWCSWRALELTGLLEKPQLAHQLDVFLSLETDRRLGARFERLIEFGLQHLPGVECVERRLQVYEKKQTSGEFDFIVRDLSTGGLEHWEVASKFYLGVPTVTLAGSSSSGATVDSTSLNWVGPGKRDSLIKKLKHLSRKQLVLSGLPEARATIEALGAEITQVRGLLKGRLFYPLCSSHVHDTSFEFDTGQGIIRLNPHAPFGFWCDFNELKVEKPQSIYALSKSQWLDPVTDRRQELDMEELGSLIESAPQCVGVVANDGQLQRWFVTRTGWFDDLDPLTIS